MKKGKVILKKKKKKKKKGKLKKWLEKKKKKKKAKQAEQCHRRMGCSPPACPFPIPYPIFPPTPTPTMVPPGQTGKRRRKRGIFSNISKRLAAKRRMDDDECIDFFQNLNSPSSTSQRHSPSPQSDPDDEDVDDQEDKDEGQKEGVQEFGVDASDVRDLMKEIGLGRRKFLG